VIYRLAALVACAVTLGGQTSQSPQDLLKEAVTLHQAGKLDAAIKDYRELLKAYPNQPQIRSNLGAALVGAGRYDEAIAEYKKALGLHDDPKVRLNLALAYYKASEIELARQELVKVRQALPDNEQALMLLADCKLEAGENKVVIDLLTPMREKKPNDLGVAYMLGTALIRDGNTSKGQIVIDSILKNGDSAEARLLMGATKMSVKDFSSAIEDLKRAAELNPNLPDVHSYYGMALLATGDQAGARKAFEEELQHNPNNFDANLRMGVLLKQDQDFDRALQHFERALKTRPGDIATRFQIASVTLAQSRVDVARAQFENIVKESPTFTEAHVTLATIYYRQKRKADGDRERKIVEDLTAKRQATEPAAKVQQ
jgi:tetratricopeptide (TPR) repeat protein